MTTIIVLLILAGVTVATLTGENALLSKAQLSKERSLEAEEDEKDKLSSYKNEIDTYVSGNRDDEAEINLLKSRITQLESQSLVSVDFTTSNKTGWTKVADYPTGYTRDNCIIVSGYAWWDDTNQKVILPFRDSSSIQLEQRSDGIYTNATDGGLSKSGKIYLQKVN